MISGHPIQILSAACLLLAVAFRIDAAGREDMPPPPPREFRAAWVASVHNINWPSRPGLSTAQQKSELVRIFEESQKIGLNAIVLQVRPACDALYPSSLEPWSSYLTGTMGQAPSPNYDPLEFAVREAHARGLELHAWFNPFRALASSGIPAAKNHVTRAHASAVRPAGSMKWLDPGLEFSRRHTLAVIRDVVRRYDIDGVHIDDYFYPYPVDPSKGPFPFDDSASYNAYRAAGGNLDRADWRRRNIDTFVESLYRTIKAEKPWVKFGISPFGIWRPGYPSGIEAGLDSCDHIFADSRKWLSEGWCDYFSPQLYWRIGDRPHSFTSLIGWWKGESKRGRHVWPGIASDRIASEVDPGRPPEESSRQIEASRAGQATKGHIHWSIAPLLQNRKGVSALLARGVYRQPALVPASPWLSRKVPSPPTVEIFVDRQSGQPVLKFPAGSDAIAWWVVQNKIAAGWTTHALFHRTRESIPVTGTPEAIAVSAVDRYGNASSPTILVIK